MEKLTMRGLVFHAYETRPREKKEIVMVLKRIASSERQIQQIHAAVEEIELIRDMNR